jgi:hypothetical protein
VAPTGGSTLNRWKGVRLRPLLTPSACPAVAQPERRSRPPAPGPAPAVASDPRSRDNRPPPSPHKPRRRGQPRLARARQASAAPFDPLPPFQRCGSAHSAVPVHLDNLPRSPRLSVARGEALDDRNETTTCRYAPGGLGCASSFGRIVLCRRCFSDCRGRSTFSGRDSKRPSACPVPPTTCDAARRLAL